MLSHALDLNYDHYSVDFSEIPLDVNDYRNTDGGFYFADLLDKTFAATPQM